MLSALPGGNRSLQVATQSIIISRTNKSPALSNNSLFRLKSGFSAIRFFTAQKKIKKLYLFP